VNQWGDLPLSRMCVPVRTATKDTNGCTHFHVAMPMTSYMHRCFCAYRKTCIPFRHHAFVYPCAYVSILYVLWYPA
jgi:hypothetical protein